VLLLIAVGFVVAAFVWRARRRGGDKKLSALSPAVADAVRLYRDLERALTTNGRARPSARTPLEHARELEHDGFVQAGDVREVTESYMRVRYGGGAIPERELQQLREAVARVKRAPRPDVGPRPGA